MSSRRRLGVVALASIIGSLGALGGCVDNSISISNVGWVGPDVGQAMSQGCVHDSASLFISRGTYDVDLAKLLPAVPYSATLEIQNELETISTSSIDTQSIEVTSFDVQVVPQGPISSVLTNTSDLVYSYPVGSGRLTAQETGFFTIQALSGSLIKALAAMPADPMSSITLRARPVYSHGGSTYSGSFASLPIDICHGCLSNAVNGAFPACSTLKGVMPNVGNVCNYAADESVTCCTSSGTLVCGSAVTAASAL